MDEAQRELNTTVTRLSQTVQDLAIAVSTLRAEMPTRADIQTEINKRLPMETYTIAHTALEREVRENHQEFEHYVQRAQGGWQRAAPWVAIVISIIFGVGTFLLTFGLAAVGGIFFLAQHLTP